MKVTAADVHTEPEFVLVECPTFRDPRREKVLNVALYWCNAPPLPRRLSMPPSALFQLLMLARYGVVTSPPPPSIVHAAVFSHAAHGACKVSSCHTPPRPRLSIPPSVLVQPLVFARFGVVNSPPPKLLLPPYSLFQLPVLPRRDPPPCQFALATVSSLPILTVTIRC